MVRMNQGVHTPEKEKKRKEKKRKEEKKRNETKRKKRGKKTIFLAIIDSLRPILTELDLQSFEKVPFSTFASAFAPTMLEIGLPRLGTT